MNTTSDRQRHKAANRAAAAVFCVIAFAAAYVGLIMALISAPTSSSPDEDEVAFNGIVQTEPFYVLLIGSDSRRGTALYTGQSKDESQVSQYADIITLMRVDPSTYTITLVSIPRDTVTSPTGGKINAELLSNNPQDVVDAASELTGVSIDYYMMTTFITFENLVNALGGIEVDVPVTVSTDDPSSGKTVTVQAGEGRHLNGSEALTLARAREEYTKDQDALRQLNVRNIETALIRKVLDAGSDLDIDHILTTIEHDTYTNIDASLAGSAIVQFVQHADEVTFYGCTGLYEGTQRDYDGKWVVVGDEETWHYLMEVVDAGQDPSGVIPQPEF